MAATVQHTAFEIPDKSYFRIGEVSRLTSTKPFVLRYWETEFPMLQPVKTPKGHRLYRREDIETVLEIKHLLYEEGFTIAGARRHLQGHPAEMGSESAVAVPTASLTLETSRPQPPQIAPPADRTPRPSRNALEAVRTELEAILTLLEPR